MNTQLTEEERFNLELMRSLQKYENEADFISKILLSTNIDTLIKYINNEIERGEKKIYATKLAGDTVNELNKIKNSLVCNAQVNIIPDRELDDSDIFISYFVKYSRRTRRDRRNIIMREVYSGDEIYEIIVL